MKVTLAICIIVGIVAQVSQVNAVKCNDVSTCIKTVYTTATCEKNVCKCAQEGYVPTEEGCVVKPEKPTVETQNNLYNFEAFEAADVLLTCATNVDKLQFTYIWYKNGEKTDQTTKDATFKMDKADAKFKCNVQLGGAQSDSSEEVTVKLLKKDGTSNAKPVPGAASPKVAAGKRFGITCAGSPFGAIIVFTDEKAQTLTSPVTQPDDVSGKTIKCVFTHADFTFNEPAVGMNYPEVITTFDSVAITSMPATAFHLEDAPTLTCQVSPVEEYLPEGLQITYSWSKGDVKAKSWPLDKKEATYEGITCTATADKKPITSEAAAKITINDNYLPKPKLYVSPTRPAVTSQVSLECITPEKDVQISWLRNNVLLAGQNDTTIQIGDLAALHDDFQCGVTKDGFTANSDSFKLNVQEQLAKPVVKGVVNVGKWGSLKLMCSSASAVPKMTYTWAKKGTAIKSATGSNYTIEEVENTDAGEYSCTTKFAKLDAQTSDNVVVKIITPGVICNADKDCQGGDKSLSGKCDVKAKRCECANHYYAKGNGCSNGVAEMSASLVVVLMAALVSRFF